ncbi:MAG TPA: HAD family phosphatase [Steroidobacteraceae bacterium]|nr:HAD family phosphatase [Steroidobacteraceae bacterium]
MSAVRNVVMDLGGVMLDWNPDLLLTPFEPEPQLRRQLRAKIFGVDWQQFDRGRLTELELVGRLAVCSGQTRDRVIEIIRAARESLVEKPETIKLVRALRQRGLDIYCLSNMPAPMYEHLRQRHTFWDVFSGVVVSGEIQLMKPEPQIYLHLLERFGLIADESVFIDDMQINVAAAKGVGLHAIRFLNAAQCEQELDALLATMTPS